MSKMHIDKNTPADELTPGGIIYQAGNAREFKTGDWRSMYPVWIPETALFTKDITIGSLEPEAI